MLSTNCRKRVLNDGMLRALCLATDDIIMKVTPGKRRLMGPATWPGAGGEMSGDMSTLRCREEADVTCWSPENILLMHQFLKKCFKFTECVHFHWLQDYLWASEILLSTSDDTSLLHLMERRFMMHLIHLNIFFIFSCTSLGNTPIK